MSWFPESKNKRTWFESFCIRVLQQGPVPRHVAFIMDGNRRYAHKLGLQNLKGHLLGFEKLTEALSWCSDLRIQEVTLYAFSRENYKRSEDEVSGLMDLFKEKLMELLKERDKLDENGIRIRIIGELSLLTPDVQKLAAEVMLHTQHHKKRTLNVCMAYTSRDEMANGVKEIAKGFANGQLELSDITEELFSKSLYFADATPPDLLIRTSGEIRLSDFLLWQSSFSVLSFIKSLWPEFTIWDLFIAIFYYQHNLKELQTIKRSMQNSALGKETVEMGDRQLSFLEDLQQKRYQKIIDMSTV